MPPLRVAWPGMLAPGTSELEVFLRGTVMYFVLLAFLRLVPQRTVGTVAVRDLLIVILIGEGAGNALGVDSLGDGIVLVATLIGWSYALNWLTYAVPAVERLISPPARPLVRDGRLLRRNLRAALITERELMRQLRLEGVAELGLVKLATLESDGTLSVVKRPPDGERPA